MGRPINREFVPTKLIFLIAFIFFANVLAQAPDLPDLTESSVDAEPSTSATPTAAPSRTSSEAERTEETTAADDETTSSESSTPPPPTTSSESPAETSLPALTITSTSRSGGLITNLPKLPQDDYPPPTVPPTANAPYMQKSTLPEGTVFICVGAFLGFVAFIVIAWRGLVAWSIHRSVRRAALAQSSKYGRNKLPPARSHSRAPLYNLSSRSTLSFDQLASGGKGRSNPDANRESLFFSPTAGAGMKGPAKRGSGYLPAGYYAAGNAAPGGGMGMTHIGGGGSGLGNANNRYTLARSIGATPPRSPSLPPSRGNDGGLGRPGMAGLSMHTSNSSLNLSVPPQGRAPSAYLEDLFESHPPRTDPGNDRRRP